MSITNMMTALSEIIVGIPLPKPETEIVILPPPPPLAEQSIISLPVVYGPMILHYGSESKYERFGNSCFKKLVGDDSIITDHITSVQYRPDDLYKMVDGMSGKCWLVSVVDNLKVHKTYYIRNWHDIVNYYKTTYDMEFFEIKQYHIQDHGTWKQVIYSDEAKLQIKQYLENYPNSSSTLILDSLFPTMQPDLKQNAAYEIQVVLGRAYAGR
jgi:hypothetical protein